MNSEQFQGGDVYMLMAVLKGRFETMLTYFWLFIAVGHDPKMYCSHRFVLTAGKTMLH